MNEALEPFILSTVSFALDNLDDVVEILKSTVTESTESRTTVLKSLLDIVSSTVENLKQMVQSQMDSLTDEVKEGPLEFTLKQVSQQIESLVSKIK